ncbi:MAG: NAD(P)-dependent oxidoreductase, partial [Endozoicomonas sp.]
MLSYKPWLLIESDFRVKGACRVEHASTVKESTECNNKENNVDYLPLFLQVRNQLCLVVGGGDIALRKVRLLMASGASIRVVAPDIDDDIRAVLTSSGHQLIERGFEDRDVQGVCLVIAATDDSGVNRRVSAVAQSRQLFVNVVDDADAGNAVMPAIVDRSPVVAAFSTGGKAPVLARLIRQKLETILPQGFGRLAVLAGECRQLVQDKFQKINDRRYFWETLFEGPVAEQALAGNIDQARRMLVAQLEATEAKKTGEVYLVGGGPGDPDLLTFKALRLMQQADVVLHDRLVSERVLALCRRDADYIYVG